MQYFFASGKPNTMPSDDEIKDLLAQYLKEYLYAACGSETVATVRMQNLFRRLERTSFLLLKNLLQEFLQGDFFPVLFELPMRETQTGESAKTMQIPLEDGTVVGLVGQIDRVDIYRKGSKVYLRVVDYKTGKKEFKLETVLRGYQLQMLIYLFSLWKDPPQTLKQKCDLKAEDEVLPAGVLYFNARLPKVKSDVGKRSAEQLEEDLLIERSGVLLKDNDVLWAMEHDLKGKYIPVTAQSKKTPLLTLEDFGELYEKIARLIATIAQEMKQGTTQARPHNPNAPCDYCPYAFICRKGIKKSAL
jgi:ATP-dependent helicase/nuclease subunit B